MALPLLLDAIERLPAFTRLLNTMPGPRERRPAGGQGLVGKPERTCRRLQDPRAAGVRHPGVDVADLQVGEFGASESCGIERHQQNAMEWSQSRIDESRDFFLAQDRG